MSRRPDAIPAIDGVDVVAADFDDPASLAAAVDGITALFLVTMYPSAEPKHDQAMLTAAAEAGVSRVVKLSAIGTGERLDAETTVGGWHLAAEQAVTTSGLSWTLLRPSTFASNLLTFASLIESGRPLPDPAGGARQGVIDPVDVAAVAAEALTGAGHAGRTYTLTGPESLSLDEQAEILRRVLERPISTVDLTLAEAREQLLAVGRSPAAADMALTGVAWVRRGHNAVVTDDVARVLGRPPTDFESWARANRAGFLGAA
ncbi:NAD(P)H azoreductase [Actinoalloteichus hoggarensis]|uniref:NAD(P)H azoreductase n=2 Tax=Actinoalloteichus hoggarensis TaxID=1470176 RepID=A0A221VZQ5_9PSEU|nr:NAD(P)H azoreductase [Actinoalloteichus hoggarensis]